jgi:hypothetical protein
MRSIFWALLVVAVLSFSGCKDRKPIAVEKGPLVPTAEEREILRAFRLQAQTERGQRKIRELRVNKAKIEAARAEARSWVEKANEKKAAASAQ